jgi:hypothetical protein
MPVVELHQSHKNARSFIDEKQRLAASRSCGRFGVEEFFVAFDVANRGLKVLYRPGIVNFCPGCGRAHWYVGRFSAECGFCGTALPLVETGLLGSGTHSRNKRPHDARMSRV